VLEIVFRVIAEVAIERLVGCHRPDPLAMSVYRLASPWAAGASGVAAAPGRLSMMRGWPIDFAICRR